MKPAEYTVVVGNIGEVYRGESREEADDVFDSYQFDSLIGYGRCGYEDVTLFKDGEIVKEHRLPFVVGFNAPGYMPDEQPSYVENFDIAKRYLIGIIKHHEEEAETEDAAEEFAAAAEDVNHWNEPNTVKVGGFAYWIQER